ncbi:MAG: protein kinase [Gemmatimonadales bacterium]
MTDTARLSTALGDRYRIDRELGAGGMATVYLATDLKHARAVALKVLRPELAAVLGGERFLQEIRIAARLDHPHILTLIDSGAADGFLYYVLPYVRGESLRDRLTREKQLGLDEALTITKQVASALDYAHRQGVIHRDIKPENILLQEGEAMLADFGIALAVREAGGNRLTESGTSLGTPQYMSPEQATGDRQLDARSDLYSLAAVLYEMLAGDPPHTGATVQAVIAKLLTERPTGLRVVRATIPEGVDEAVAQALAKVPADRYRDIPAFVAALTAGAMPTVLRSSQGPSRQRLAVFIGLPLGLLLVVAAGLVLFWNRSHSKAPAAFNIRTQVTFTGNATKPALSADATQIAYVVHECTASGCQDGIEMQDVDGSAKRRVVDGASVVYLNYSPDRRFLLFWGTFGGRSGQFLVSTLGGAPRYLGQYSYAFLWGGDSLITVDGQFPDTVGWLKTEGLDGDARDSVRVHGLRGGYAMAFPGDRWLLLAGVGPGGHEGRVVSREGQQSDVVKKTLPQDVPLQVGGDAGWFSVALGGNRRGLVRLPVDLRTGKFLFPADTVLDAASAYFDVSADGKTIAYVEGGRQWDMWVLPLADALNGRFSPEHDVFHSTSQLTGGLSPDGKHALVGHAEAGQDRSRVVESIIPSTGGSGVDFNAPEDGRGAPFWTEDGGSIFYRSDSAGVLQLVTINPQTGLRTGAFTVADTGISTYDLIPGGGLAWMPASHDRVRIRRHEGDTPRDFLLPSRERGFNVNVSPNGARLVVMSFIPSTDSLVLNVVSMSDGKVVRWAVIRGQLFFANWVSDGSIMATVTEAGNVQAIYRFTAPGKVQRLGAVPRATAITWSRDGRSVAVITSEVRGDVWLAHNSARPPQGTRR